MNTNSIILAGTSFALALGMGISAIIALIPLAGTGFSAFVRQRLGAFFRLLPERKMTWGTVYDALTKRPIPYATMRLIDGNRRVLETRVADRDGKYGFLVTPASLHEEGLSIEILPSAPGYVFPSQRVPDIDGFIYNNLYHGGLVVLDQQKLVNFDIPLDPVEPRIESLVRTSPSIAVSATLAALADIGLWAGLVVVPLSVIITPNPFTIGVLCVYLGTLSLRIFGVRERPFGIVLDVHTKKPLPFSLIVVMNKDKERIAYAVSDERGRYVLTLPAGLYTVEAHTSAQIVPGREKREQMKVSHGWLTSPIYL